MCRQQGPAGPLPTHATFARCVSGMVHAPTHMANMMEAPIVSLDDSLEPAATFDCTAVRWHGLRPDVKVAQPRVDAPDATEPPLLVRGEQENSTEFHVRRAELPYADDFCDRELFGVVQQTDGRAPQRCEPQLNSTKLHREQEEAEDFKRRFGWRGIASDPMAKPPRWRGVPMQPLLPQLAVAKQDGLAAAALAPAAEACWNQGHSSGTPVPAWLWSFPGSGNTVTRLLTDAASGFTSASLYADASLRHVLPGESLVHWNMARQQLEPLSFVKTHTFTAKQGAAKVLPFLRAWPRVARTATLVREPFSAVLAEFTRYYTNSHTGTLPEEFFSKDENVEHFRSRCEYLALEWRDTVAAHQRCLHMANPGRRQACKEHLLVKLEDLLQPDNRAETLRRLVEFVNVTVDDERLACAYQHAEAYHRRRATVRRPLRSLTFQ